MFFSYLARQPGQVKPQKGQVEAESLSEAIKRVKAQGFILLKIESIESRKSNLSFFSRKKVPLKEKIIFTKQLSVMLRAGLPVIKALEALQRQTGHSYFKEIIGNLIREIRGGQTLSLAMTKYPQIFPDVYVSVVKAGEESGQLADVLLDLSVQQEKDAELISKIKGAMIYPAVIMVALIAVVIIVIVFVLPSLSTIFAESGHQLPFLTRMLLGTSNLVRHDGIFLLIGLIGIFYALRLWFSRPTGRAVYDRLKLRLPVFGSLTQKVYMARFSRTLALLTKASLPVLKSIQIVKKTISNVHFDQAFVRIEKEVESGKAVSVAIAKEPLFPPMVGQLASLGEETGDLERVLLEIAEFYDKEVDQISKNLSTLIEPIMLIVMGIGVGFVVAAVLGPIYGLVQTF